MRACRAAVVVLASGSIWLAVGGCAQLPPHVQWRIREGARAYEANDLGRATAALDAVLREYPDHPSSAEAYYLRGLCRIRAGQSAAAREDLERCLGLSARADLTAKACASLGGLAHDAGRLERAAAYFERALRDLPEAPPTDEVRYRYGICLQRLGRWNDARGAFSSLIHQYPHSPYVDDARRRFSWPNAFFSIQCGAFVKPAEARAAAGRLLAQFPDVRTEPEARSGRPMYLVYVGRCPTYEEAQKRLHDVRREVAGAFVVP